MRWCELVKTCTGCKSCIWVCPYKAITIEEKENKFYKIIDKKKCVGCGQCRSICHLECVILNEPKEAFVAQSRIYKYRKFGASGGIASTFYKYGIENDFLCVGTMYNEGKVKYSIVDSFDKIKKTSGSRYVISELEHIFPVLNDTDDNKNILFIGLPCHCSAIRRLNKNKKIIFVDLVCNGVCSEKKLKEEIKKQNINLGEIDDIRFRNKNNQYGITYIDSDGCVISKVYKSENDYMKSYEKKESIFNHCLDCVYAQSNRVGDITIKDYIWKYGVSNVLINTIEGKKFWEHVAKYIFYRRYPIEKVIEEDDRIKRRDFSPVLSQN